MAKQTVEFTRAERYGTEGFLFQTADGTQLIFNDIQEVRDYVASIETQEIAVKMGIARQLFQEPNLALNAQNKLAYLPGKALDWEPISSDPVVIR